MLKAYLERIGLELPLAADAASLRRLQLAHMLHVPFENLDIALGRPIRLGLTTLYDKIVTRRRGGFCYELNGLFAWLLDDLGFEVTYLSASDLQGDGTYGLDFDHLVLLVRCPADAAPEVPWLVDVGWGDTFRFPLRAELDGEQDGGLKTYRITTNPPEGAGVDENRRPRRPPSGTTKRCQLWERHTNGVWERQYAFTTQPRAFADFEPMCRYHQTSPESIFTRKQICTLATPDGRVSLEDNHLIITHHGAREEREVAPEEKAGLLRELFGIDLAC